MSDGFTVTIPGPSPALNSTYKIVTLGGRCPTCGRGKSTLAKESSVGTWQDETAWRVRAAKPSGWTPGRRIRITVAWYTPRRKDCDAGAKALLDAVAVGLGIDDAPFLLTVAANEVDKADPRTVVEVRNE